MQGRVVYVSKSGQSGVIAVDTKSGEIVESITGFMKFAEGVTKSVGDSIDLGDISGVRKETRTVEAEDGTTLEFDWLVIG
jgi:hypothetical protein